MLCEKDIQNCIYHLILIKHKIHISHCLEEYKSLREKKPQKT